MNWIIIAKIKIFKDRLMSWGILINFLMLLCLTLGIKLQTIHLVIFGIIVLIVTVIDMKYILPREQEYYFQRNPEWQKR